MKTALRSPLIPTSYLRFQRDRGERGVAAVSSTLCNFFLLIYCLPTVRATETFAACMKRNYRADSQRERESCFVTAGEIAATTVARGEEEYEGG